MNITHSKIRTICFAVIVFSFCCVGLTEAVTIKMKSGRTVEGEIIERTAESIKIRNDQGTYNIPIKQIEMDVFGEMGIDNTKEDEEAKTGELTGRSYFTSCVIDFKKLPAPNGYKRARLEDQQVKFINKNEKLAVVVKFEPLPLKDKNCQMACFSKKVQDESFFKLFVKDFEKRQRINSRGYQLKNIDDVFGAEVNMVVQEVPTKFFVFYLGDQYVSISVSGDGRSFDDLQSIDFLYKEVVRKLKTLCK